MRTPTLMITIASALILTASGCDGETDIISAGKVIVPSENGQLIFTEVMPAGQPNMPSWFELTNVTELDLSLGKCTLNSRGGKAVVINTPLTVAAGESVVAKSDVGGNVAEEHALEHAQFIYPAAALPLRDADSLVLRCNGTLIARVEYQLGPYPVNGVVQSWQRHLNPENPRPYQSVASDIWCYTNPVENYQYIRAHFGSPGHSNSFCASEMPYLVFDKQEAVLLDGIDFEQTLKVAEAEFARQAATSELVIWGIRDQVITAEIARRISELYFANIDMLYNTEPFTIIDWNHAVWHFAWAISNLYRNGDGAVKQELQSAYDDALQRPETLEKFKFIAADYIRGERIVMGDAHTPAHNLMLKLIVIPGSDEYVNSYEEYLEKRRSDIVISAMHFSFVAAKFFGDLLGE